MASAPTIKPPRRPVPGAAEMEDLQIRLVGLQRAVLERNLPVIITFDGWSASGKGACIASLLQALDPRGFQVHEGRQQPQHLSALAPFWQNSPRGGHIAIFDRSWLRPAMQAPDAHRRISRDLVREGLDFERHHLDAGYIIIKIFLHLGAKQQRRRFQQLQGSSSTAWRVCSRDLEQNEHYARHDKAFARVLAASSHPEAPWHIVDADDLDKAQRQVAALVTACLEAALAHPPASSSDSLTLPPAPSPSARSLLAPPKEPRDYKKKLRLLQAELHEISHALHLSRTPVILVFEGWDAAGKGGAIRRLCRAFDPRMYQVLPVAAPTKDELARHYLWRFWRDFPQPGRMAIFDRSWYGRLLVERIEGFCRPDDWRRATGEISSMESHLARAGIVILKFWLDISSEEQSRRFEHRLQTPHKHWKITAEDWRNRDKWQDYERAVDDMLHYTSSTDCPWHVIAGDNKHHARLQVMQKVLKQLRRHLDQLAGR